MTSPSISIRIIMAAFFNLENVVREPLKLTNPLEDYSPVKHMMIYRNLSYNKKLTESW